MADAHPYKELEMLHPPLPPEVNNALLLHHLIQDDLLAVGMLLDVVDNVPDGACYLPLGPGVAQPGRSDDLSYKDRFQLLIQHLECYVIDAYNQVDQELVVLRKRYPNYKF
jgi:hypothetical protein